MISLAQNMWSWTRVHFPLRHLAKEHLQLARKETFFCEIDKETVRLFDSRLQLSKRTFCNILSNCRSERDVETGEIGQNQDITSYSEDETDFTDHDGTMACLSTLLRCKPMEETHNNGRNSELSRFEEWHRIR